MGLGFAVHRHDDMRSCGATTIVENQTTVFANGLLIAVNGDPNSHGSGDLVAGSNQVFIGGIAVVNNTPDIAGADSLCPSVGGAHCSPVTADGSHNVFVGDIPGDPDTGYSGQNGNGDSESEPDPGTTPGPTMDTPGVKLYASGSYIRLFDSDGVALSTDNMNYSIAQINDKLNTI